MRIGLLAYHSAINFGATLQLLSTYSYLLNHNHQPIIINWIASDLEEQYKQHTSHVQLEEHKKLRNSIWRETALCHTENDVAKIIKEEKIEAVIIGSDAVCQHHTVMERLVFPCRRIIGIESATSDRLFPNPFWAIWNDLLPNPIPVAILSASCQDSKYQYFSQSLRRAMAQQVKSYSYISVRDTWTRNMFAYITNNTVIPDVTPDPVFAFAHNVKALIPSREEVLKKFNIPEKYLLFSFNNSNTVSQSWINDFQTITEHDGYTCVKLPFSDKIGFGQFHKEITLPLSPLDWFALIKYSAGYIGHNMHPIVVSIHTGTPFFSFDNYGLKKFNGLVTSDKSSKIRHILETAGLADWRISCISRKFNSPSATYIYKKLQAFNTNASKTFAGAYYEKYLSTMDTIINTLTNNLHY